MKRTTENAVSTAHRLVRDVVRPGDVVVDATVGNGWDTQLLAECVGSSGIVYGFDVQQIALDVARTRLDANTRNVDLILSGHETMQQHIPAEHHGRVRAVTFNLGYLPGGEKTVTTKVDTTLQALGQALGILAPGGLITIVCYSHLEGRAEMQAVQDVLMVLPQADYSCLRTEFFNQKGNPPVVFSVYRASSYEQLP
ncbi:MAG: 16S rRNA (cytosine(1402)-N(4))-methyltransferase [Candidatus Kapabacteria bacterium]|nr:16S rRNA (cytosine(1402)-N(4))-methyltransferase [Candidatus Kapabacteria bacterium]